MNGLVGYGATKWLWKLDLFFSYIFATYFIDSAIGKMFPLTSICYDGKDLDEPLGGMPTVSLVLQVTINTSYICIRKIPYCLYLEFFEIRNT